MGLDVKCFVCQIICFLVVLKGVIDIVQFVELFLYNVSPCKTQGGFEGNMCIYFKPIMEAQIKTNSVVPEMGAELLQQIADRTIMILPSFP